MEEQNNRPPFGGPRGPRGPRPEGPGGGGDRFGGGGDRFGGGGGDRPGGPRRFGGGGGGGGRFYQRRKVDPFAIDNVRPDYKDVQRLRRLISDRAKIEPRRKSGTSAKNQRQLALAIKRARHMALLPFVSNTNR